MLASIDSPQGDHAAATAPMIALVQPRTSSCVKTPLLLPGDIPPGIQAWMIWADPGRRKRRVEVPRPSRAAVRVSGVALIFDRIADERGERLPGGRDSFAANAAVDEHEI